MMSEEQHLEQATKDRILHEELYRSQIREQLADKSSVPNTQDKVWAFLNSAFFLWLMSSVLIGLITFLYTEWEENRDERQFQAQQLVKFREAAFESLSTDVSKYIFCSDILTKGFEEKWWKRSGLESLLPKYNDAIFALRGKEYLYRGKVERLWGAEELDLFSDVITQVRLYDDLIHKVNEEIGAVTSKEKDDIDFVSVEPIVINELRPAVDALETKSKAFLNRLVNELESSQ